MPVADRCTDGTEFIGPLSALSGVQKASRADSIKKGLARCVKNVILSWPYQ